MSDSFTAELFGLDGQVVLLAGGAGTIATELAISFRRAGARVAIWSRRQASVDTALARLRDETESGDADAVGLVVDAASEAAVSAAIADSAAALGEPDVLVNAVGGNRGKGPFDQIDIDTFEEVVRLNLIAGLVVPTKLMARRWMDAGRGGAILNIASMTSFRPLSGVWAYDAAKAGVLNLTQATAKEYAPHGIRVNAIAPGFIVAEQNRRLLIADDATGEPTERGASIIARTPMGRFAEAGEMCGAALFLASRAAAGFVTGVTVPVDGGFLVDNV